MSIPKSVAAMNKHPYWFGRLQLGTLFHSWVTVLRNLHDIVTERLAYQVLSNPGIKQNTGGGGNTKMEVATATNYMINGVIYTLAATQDITVSASANTTASQYKAITISVDSTGTITQTVSAAAASAGAVVIAAPPSGSCPIATVAIPPSFTAGTTVFGTSWVTNGWRAQQALTAEKPDQLPDIDI